LTNRYDSSRLIDIKRLCKEANNLFNSLNVSNEWNIPQNIALMLVSIAVIPIMASLNAPNLSTNNGSIRPRLNSPRLEAVVVAEVDAAAEAALLVGAVAMVVIRPTPAESGRAMMLRCLQRLPLIVALGYITENGAWFANLAVEYHPYNRISQQMGR